MNLVKQFTPLVIVAVLVVGGGAFYGGMKYQQSKSPALTRQFKGNRPGFIPVAGEIITSDDKSITVKLNDGSSKIVFFSDKTQINKASSATKDELKVGEKVAIFGMTNSDGSVTAQNIQLNPLMRTFPQGK